MVTARGQGAIYCSLFGFTYFHFQSFLFPSLSWQPSLWSLFPTTNDLQLGKWLGGATYCSILISPLSVLLYTDHCRIHLLGNERQCWSSLREVTPNSTFKCNKQDTHHFGGNLCRAPNSLSGFQSLLFVSAMLNRYKAYHTHPVTSLSLRLLER